jgi:hypothetical protein
MRYNSTVDLAVAHGPTRVRVSDRRAKRNRASGLSQNQAAIIEGPLADLKAGHEFRVFSIAMNV